VDLYTTRPPEAGKPAGDEDADADARGDLPPSLLENRELRDYLRPLPGLNLPQPRIFEEVVIDGVRRIREIRPGFSGGPALTPAAAERALRARLYAYARSVLENSRVMRQYTEDLRELLGVALEPAFGADLRRRAALVCREHAKDLAKSVAELREDVSHAFPEPKKEKGKQEEKEKKEKGRGSDKSADKGGNTNKAGEDTAGIKKTAPVPPSALVAKTEEAAGRARELASRVYRFIYPTGHTVSLDDLRNPGLVAALEAFEAETRALAGELADIPVA